jgi:uncharacterized protein (TIGR02646 family)
LIQIDKPNECPEILAVTGRARVETYCEQYEAGPAAYDLMGFEFDNAIYGDKTVKDALLAAQHDKCCYCEQKFRSVTYGAVEHYRPKTGVQQGAGMPREYPGYYWLAYDWSNLFVSCDVCNTTYKRGLFPLVNPANRARSHHDLLDLEDPLLANPCENPRAHIGFRNEAPVALSDIGRVTIRTLGLRRSELDEERRKLLAQLKVYTDIITLAETDERPEWQAVAAEARAFLDLSVRAESEFSSMAIDFLGR